MDRRKRTHLRVVPTEDERKNAAPSVERLTGTSPAARFEFTTERAGFARGDMLDA
jgi:hypothetical protein